MVEEGEEVISLNFSIFVCTAYLNQGEYSFERCFCEYEYNWIFMEISKMDLAAAKCLYKSGLYSQAVFYLQQSVEKAAKSFGLLTGTVKENS